MLMLPVASTLNGAFDLAGVVTAADGFGSGARRDGRRRRHRRRRPRGRKAALAPPPLNLASGPPRPTATGTRLRARLRAARRHDAQPDALRVSRAVAEGARIRDSRRYANRRCIAKRVAFAAGVIITFVALGRGAVGTARRRRATGLGIPAAIARGGHRARDPLFRARAEPVRRIRIRPARTLQRGRAGRRRIARSTRSARASSPSSSRHRARRRSWARRSVLRWPARPRRRCSCFVALGIGMALPVCRSSPGSPAGAIACRVRGRGSSASSSCSRFRFMRR